MALPELTRKLVETKLGAYCTCRISDHVRHQVRLSFTFWRSSITLFEERAVRDKPEEWTTMPIAQFRLDVTDNLWRLYYPNLRQRNGWLLYADADPTTDFETLLLALDQDRTGVFWG